MPDKSTAAWDPKTPRRATVTVTVEQTHMNESGIVVHTCTRQSVGAFVQNEKVEGGIGGVGGANTSHFVDLLHFATSEVQSFLAPKKEPKKRPVKPVKKSRARRRQS